MKNKSMTYLWVILTICILFVGIKIGHSFLNYYQITANLAQNDNLSPGNKVSILGVQIGFVKSIILTENKVAVILKIKKDIKIPTGSLFQITKVGMFGEKEVRIIPSANTTFYKNNDKITVAESAGEPSSISQTTTSALLAVAVAAELNKKLDSIITLLNNQNKESQDKKKD